MVKLGLLDADALDRAVISKIKSLMTRLGGKKVL
jgi:hypothetical protein